VSPDGNRIVFSWERSGSREIWASDSGGIKPVCLTSLGSHSASPSWSPDGRWIAFDSTARGNWDILLVGAGGGPSRAITNQAGEDVRPGWSADGRWIYFGSDRTGTMQIWKTPLEGGEPRQVTRNGGYEAVESADGKFVYYTRRGVSGLWRIPAAGGPEVLFLPELQWENLRNWALAGANLYFLSAEGQGASLNLLDLRSSQRKALAAVDSAFIANSGISLSPDRKWFTYVRQDERETDIALVAGFR
jgi:Tol biopolymer transport system component